MLVKDRSLRVGIINHPARGVHLGVMRRMFLLAQVPICRQEIP
jgi:hypothetical protein